MSPIDPSPATAISLPSVTPPPKLAPLTPELTPQPEQEADLIKSAPTHKADVRLAGAYTAALTIASQNTPRRFEGQSVSPIPAESMFGQWRTHLDALVAAPDFQLWAKANGIDLSKPIHIYPAQGSIPAYVSGFPIPSTTNSRGAGTTRQVRKPAYESGLPSLPGSWPLIMQAARTLAPGKASVELPAPSRSSSDLHAERPARLEDLRAFYGEAWPETEAGLAQRLTKLKQADTFPLPDTSLSSEQLQMRAEEVIEHQEKELGDIQNRNQLSQHLFAILASPAGAGDSVEKEYYANPLSPAEKEKHLIAQALENTPIKVDPSSWYVQDAQLEPGKNVTLKQFISDNDWAVPQTAEDVVNLIKYLDSGHLPTVPHGNLTGAAGWQVPLSDNEKNLLFSHVRYNNLRIPALDTAAEDIRQGGAFRYLTKNRYWTDWEIGSNPRQVIQEILESPKARELEAALHKAMGNIDGTGNSDWVLGAMVLGLTDQGSRYGTERNKVGDFDLADKAFHGKPLADIKYALSEHLIKNNRTTRNMAPVARHLLLASAAPELLVKNIPASVTYGSPDWVTLKTTVAYIEAKSPGSSSLMSFADVIAYGAIEPPNEEDKALLNEVAQHTIVDWALVHGVLTPSSTGTYSAEELNTAQKVHAKVMNDVSKITSSLNADIPRQKDIALELLNRQFSNVSLETAVITNPQARTNNALNDGLLHVNTGPYSLLDMYLSEHFPTLKENDQWYSLDPEKVPADAIKLLGSLPDAKPAHREAVADYLNARTDGLVNLTKHLIASLSIEDRRHLEHGAIEVFVEGTVSKERLTLRTGTHDIENLTPTQDKNTKSLIFRATLGNSVKSYKFLPQQNSIQLLDDFKPGLQGDWVKQPTRDSSKTVHTNTAISEFKLSEVDKTTLQGTQPSQASNPASYTSNRSQFLGELLATHVYGKPNLDTLVEASSYTTRFNEEDDEFENNKEVLLGSIPGVNLIRNVVKGDWLAVGSDLLFDGIMYATTAGLGNATKPFKSLRSAAKQTRKFFGSQPSTPTADFSKLLHRKTGHYDLSRFATDPDIAQGTYKKGNTTLSTPAKLDKKTGAWHAFDPTTNRHYGKPLENFQPYKLTDTEVPGTSRSALLREQRALEKSLGRDNVIQMGGAMKDLKLIGNEVHTFTDIYKGTNRLNIVAHGHQRDFFDKITGNGTQVVIDNVAHDAKSLVSMLRNKGVDPATFDNVRLLICHSAEGRSKAFSRLFKQEIGGKPVKAFEGTVTMTQGSTAITQAHKTALADTAQLYPNATPQTVETLADQMMRRAFVSKVTPQIRKNHGQTIRVNIAPANQLPVYDNMLINYQPRHFRR